MHTQSTTKRRSFIVTVPVWTHHNGQDQTLKLLREALEESFIFGMSENRQDKVVVRAMPKAKKSA